MAKIKNYQFRLVVNKKVIKWLKILAIFLLSSVFLVVICFSIFSLIYRERIYPGVYLGGTSLSGLSIDQASTLVKDKSDLFLNQKIELLSDQKKYELSPTEISTNYDFLATAKRAYEFSRGNSFADYWSRVKLIFRKNKIVSIYQVNDIALGDKITSIASELDQPEKDFGVKIVSGKVQILEDRQDGVRVNQERLLSEIKNRLSELKVDPITIIVETKHPSITRDEAETAKADLEAILAGGELTLYYADKNYPVDLDTLGNWLLATPKDGSLIVDVDREKVRDQVKTIASSIDIGSQDAMLKVSGGKVEIATASRDGVIVDQETTLSRIVVALIGRIQEKNRQALSSSRVLIETKIQKPSITSETLSTLGLTDLIGSGTTNFSGSPTNRVSNITVGARLLNGSLIKPGDTFSTLDKLGVIDASSGFLPELVIKENRTVPEYGGGLCQVSTTLFRAALNSGLEIVERQNHRYRVSYYEPPVGMDATIYDPAPDFKFKNDTTGYILVQSKVSGNKITFDFYGTKDGRTVTISDPLVSEVTPPPAPILEPTDTLPTGEQKQVERAHDGATASFVYSVVRNGQELHKRTFTSRYVPWPARILVGTGPVAPTITPPEAVPPPAPTVETPVTDPTVPTT